MFRMGDAETENDDDDDDGNQGYNDYGENDDEAVMNVNNWCSFFQSPLEANRFVSTWRRRPLPRFKSLPFRRLSAAAQYGVSLQ